MKEYDAVFEKAPLFEGISLQETHKILQCRGSRVQSYQNDEIICREGSRLIEIGLILRGRVRSYKNEYAKVMLFDLPAGHCFGSTFIFNGISELPVTFIAVGNTEILFLNLVKLIHCCPKICRSHGRLIENLMRLTIEKNGLVQLKKEMLKQNDCRSKVLLNLLFMKEKNQNNTFDMSVSREKWAAFLNVQKNDLTNVLIGLKKEGIIDYNRSRFTILDETALPQNFITKLNFDWEQNNQHMEWLHAVNEEYDRGEL